VYGQGILDFGPALQKNLQACALVGQAQMEKDAGIVDVGIYDDGGAAAHAQQARDVDCRCCFSNPSFAGNHGYDAFEHILPSKPAFSTMIKNRGGIKAAKNEAAKNAPLAGAGASCGRAGKKT
jgi:hypothetical protein